MAKIEVPADTLPVRGATALVATIPVPASPSGGAKGRPTGSRPFIQAEPSAVSRPASCPASRTRGSTSRMFQGWSRVSCSNFFSISSFQLPVALSMGNIPEASPTPTTFSPVSI